MSLQFHFNRDLMRKIRLPAPGFEPTSSWITSSCQDITFHIGCSPLLVATDLSMT